MNKEELLLLLKNDEEIIEVIKNIKKSDKSKKLIETNIKQKEEIEMLTNLVEKFKKCFHNEEIKTENLRDDIAVTNEKLSKLELQKSSLEEDIEKLQNLKKDMELKNKEIETSNSTLSDKVEFYRKNFDDELTAYEQYSSLSEHTKSSLSGIFKDESLEGFLSCGVQEKNIQSLWEYIRSELIEDSNPDIANLIQIFDYLFSKYTIAYPIYKKQEVNSGESFNTDIQIRASSSSSVSGDISKVILYGWVNTKTDKIVKKSVVKVG